MIKELRPCPFCGNSNVSKGDLKSIRLIEENSSPYGLETGRRKIFYVQCGKCFARSGRGVAGYNALSQTHTSEHQAQRKAVNRWNVRKEV